MSQHGRLQVWFPSNWTSYPGVFPNTTALDYFLFMLQNVPDSVYADAALFPFLSAAGAQVLTRLHGPPGAYLPPSPCSCPASTALRRLLRPV